MNKNSRHETAEAPQRFDPTHWPVARFPSSSTRAEFLDRLRLWSRVEGAPTVDVFPLGDGRTLRYRRDHAVEEPVAALVHACGGFVRR